MRGVQAAARVGAVLVEQHADERLDAREEDRALLEQVLVVERRLGTAELRGRCGDAPGVIVGCGVVSSASVCDRAATRSPSPDWSTHLTSMVRRAYHQT